MIDKTKISASQFMFTVACFIQSSSLLTSYIVSITKHCSWFVIIIGTILSLFPMLIYFGLMLAFPNKSLIEINDDVFGKIFGKVFSVLYIFFFMSLSALNLKDASFLVKATLLPQTPLYVIAGIITFVCTLAVRNGLNTVTRYNSLFSILSILVAIVTIVFSVNIMDVERLLPIFDYSPIAYVQGTHIVMTIPFGEMITILMITPSVRLEPKKRIKFFIFGFIIGAMTLLVVVLRDITILGRTIELFALPTFEALKLIYLNPTISRMEVLVAIVLIVLLFSKVTFLFYISVIAISQIFNLKKYKFLAACVGAILIIYSLFVYRSNMVHTKCGQSATPVLWTLFEFILPLITLITAKIKCIFIKKPLMPVKSTQKVKEEKT